MSWNPLKALTGNPGGAYAQAKAQMTINAPIDPNNIPVVPDGSGKLVKSQLFGGGQDRTKIRNVKVGHG